MFLKLKELIHESRRGLLLVTYGLVLYFIIVNIGAFFGLAFSFFDLIRPMFLGLGMAYILNLPMVKIEHFLKEHTQEPSLVNKKSRAIAITLTLILAVLLIILMFVVIVPQLIESLIALFSNVGIYINNIVNFFIDLLDNLHIDNEYIHQQLTTLQTLPWDQIFNNVLSWLGNASSSIGNMATDVVNRTIDFIGELGIWLTGFMVSIYLLSGKEQFIYQARKLTIAFLGKKYSQHCFYWGHIVNETFANFIGGQLVEAFILFLLYYVCMTLLRMPYALVISALIGITSIVPVFGAMCGSAIGVVLILAINPLKAVGFYVFYQLLQQFENNVIYPRVVGNSVGLPGVWVLISILAFGSKLGILGMFIAVPASAVIYQAVRELCNFLIGKREIKLNAEGFVQEEKKGSEN